MRIGRVYPVLVCFVLTCNYVSARFKTITEKSPVIVAVGDTALLQCRTSIPGELTEVRWIRIQGGRNSLINLFRDGRDQQRCDLQEYVGRTEVMTEDLARGRVALKLFHVSVADEGTYRCYLETVDYFDFGDLKLNATALGSDPRIDIEGSEDGGLKAVCRSAGWHPEPTIVNKVDNGKMETRKEGNGLYSIEYSRVITENSNWTFSCLIRTPFPNQERESSLYIRDDLFRRSEDIRCQILNYPLIAALFLLLLLLFAVVIFKTQAPHRKKTRCCFCSKQWGHSPECGEQPERCSHRHKMSISVARELGVYLDKKGCEGRSIPSPRSKL